MNTNLKRTTPNTTHLFVLPLSSTISVELNTVLTVQFAYQHNQSADYKDKKDPNQMETKITILIKEYKPEEEKTEHLLALPLATTTCLSA